MANAIFHVQRQAAERVDLQDAGAEAVGGVGERHVLDQRGGHGMPKGRQVARQADVVDGLECAHGAHDGVRRFLIVEQAVGQAVDGGQHDDRRRGPGGAMCGVRCGVGAAEQADERRDASAFEFGQHLSFARGVAVGRRQQQHDVRQGERGRLLQRQGEGGGRFRRIVRAVAAVEQTDDVVGQVGVAAGDGQRERRFGGGADGADVHFTQRVEDAAEASDGGEGVERRF